MDNHFFLNSSIPPSLPHFDSNPSISPPWQHFSSAMEMHLQNLNSSSSPHSLDCILAPDRSSFQFDSALSSVTSVSNPSNDSFVIRELIGKLGSGANSERISQAQHSHQFSGNQTNSSYSAVALNSPPEMSFLGNGRLVKENTPGLCNSNVAEFSTDPEFAERAARFSCFGSRSFNGRRNSHLAPSGNDFSDFRSNDSIASQKLSRVSSSPCSLKALGSETEFPENKNSSSSQDESTLSEQNPNAGKELKASEDVNRRKRKANSKGKLKEPSSSTSPSTAPRTQIAEANEKSSPKRCKTAETNGNEKGNVKTEEDSKKPDGNGGKERETKGNSKPPEPPKDYIHVRARRGQATDSHSLAERVRREKISERMKLLQDLVPGCNKVTGKALMLDEIINYVQSLQHQVEFLSMKLASVNTRMDFNMDSLISKEMYQSGNPLGNPQVSHLESSASGLYGQQNPQLLSSSSYATARASSSSSSPTHCSMDPLNSVLCQPPSLHGFGHNASQYPTFGEDDLQTIVQMGFVQIQNGEIQNFNLGSDQDSQMKVEL